MKACYYSCVVALGAISMSTGCERMTGTTPTFPTRPSDKPPIGTPNDPLGTSANVSRAQKTAREWKWQELEGPLERHVETAVFSPDGSLVAAGAGDTICVWAAENGKQISRMKLPETQIYHRLVFSADGKTLVSDCREDRMIRFWDVRTGKQKRELAHVGGDSSPSNFSSRWMAFAPDGSVMALNGPSGTAGYGVHLLDLETGSVKTVAKMTSAEWDAWSEVSFAPDGKTFALNGPRNQLRIFDTASTKLVKEFRPPGSNTRGGWTRSFVRFSPDGKFLIAQEHTGRVETFDIYRYVIWGVEDGRCYWSSEKTGGWMSGGNRYLIGFFGKNKTVLDLLTDQEVAIRNAPTTDRRLIGMSRYGKVLAFVGTKTGAERVPGFPKLSVFLTPAPTLPDLGGHPDGDLSPADLDIAWGGAIADNLFRREFSIKLLSARSRQSVGHARKVLKPVAQTETDHLLELMKRLDDDDPDVRDKATADLQKIAHRFEPFLLQAHKKAKPGEVRNRLASTVKKMETSSPPAELLAELRGMAVLEELRTSDARKLLEEIAHGAAESRITVEAAAALKRVDQPRR